MGGTVQGILCRKRKKEKNKFLLFPTPKIWDVVVH